MRWSEKPSAPSSGRAWLASRRALSTSEASGSGMLSGVAGSCLSTSVARSGGAGLAGQVVVGHLDGQGQLTSRVNLPGPARIGQRGGRGRAAGEQAGGAAGRQGRGQAGLGRH